MMRFPHSDRRGNGARARRGSRWLCLRWRLSVAGWSWGSPLRSTTFPKVSVLRIACGAHCAPSSRWATRCRHSDCGTCVRGDTQPHHLHGAGTTFGARRDHTHPRGRASHAPSRPAHGQGLTEPLGAAVALVCLQPVLRGREFVIHWLLCFVGGIMTAVSVLELVPEVRLGCVRACVRVRACSSALWRSRSARPARVGDAAPPAASHAGRPGGGGGGDAGHHCAAIVKPMVLIAGVSVLVGRCDAHSRRGAGCCA